MKRVLTWHERLYLAGFRKGLRAGLAEARKLLREEMTTTIKELEEARAAYEVLAMQCRRVLLDRAIETAQAERQSEENRFRPLH